MDVKSAVYDAEAERLASLKLLYKFFCNNLVLGQWELARACVQQLHRDGKSIGVNIGDILRDIAHYPYGKSTGCKTIPSPHHLSWLCLQAVKDISSNESQDVEKLEKEINFRMLLVEAAESASAAVIKELYQCHQASLWSESVPAPKATSATLSSESQSFLHGILLLRADLGHAIIEALMRPDLTDHRNNELLQGLYVQAVNTLLDALGSGQKGLAPGVSLSGQAAKVYELLSMYSPHAYWNYIQLRLLCARLIKLCGQEQAALQKERVMSALLGRPTPYLIDEFCKVDYELLLQVMPAPKSGGLGEMLEDQRHALHFLGESDPELRWRHLFQLSSSRQCHVLELILDTALTLVRGERWEELDKLLKCRELQPLRPLVLLLGWSSCRQPSAARGLLHTLWNEHFPCRHPALVAGCHNLSYQIDLIQWCLDKAKPLIDSAGGWEVRQQQRAVELFQGLGAHSVLFVLHQATRLASLHHQEVLQLLRNTQPRKDDEPERRKKFVRFSTSSTEDSTDEEQGTILSPQLVNLEQERDIAIFRGYCALKNVMDVIYFCADHASLHLMNPVYVKRSLQPRNLSSMFGEELVASSSEEDSSWNGMSTDEAACSAAVSPDEFQKLYDENVSQKLVEARSHLSQLHPLTFRVEVLENVFSLLFVTHRDVEDWGVQPEGDSPDEDAEKSIGQCNSSDSLITYVLSEEDLTSKRPHQMPTSRQPTSSTPISKSQPAASAFPGSAQPVGGNYDDPYVSPLRVSQSQHNQVTVPENKLADGDGGHQSEGKTKLRRNLFPTHLKPKGLDYRSSSGPSNQLGDSDVGLTGFLCNEYVTRDVLAVLKDALSDLNLVHFQLQGGKLRTSGDKQKESAVIVDPAVEEALVQFVKSSVTPDELQQRITQLVRRVNEAQWRFQMVAHDSLPKQPGLVLKEPVLISREEFGELCVTETRQNSRVKGGGEKRQGLVSESSDAVAGRSDSSSNHLHLRRALLPLNSRPSRGIIPMMLSSPETLLAMNLLKGNYIQAQQVIKLFKLEGQPLAVEANFIEAFNDVASRMHVLDTSGTDVKQPARPKKKSIKALASVAAAGMATAALSNIAEDLLVSPNIPPLPLPRAMTSNTDASPPVPGGVTKPLALLLDLLCAACHSWELAHTMLEVIKPHIPQVDKEDRSDAEFVPTLSDPRPKADKIKGCAKFVYQLQNLINLGSESYRGELEEGKSFSSGVSATIAAVTEEVRKGLDHLMCSATLPLHSSRMQHLIGVREDIRHVYGKVLIVMNESGQLMRSESVESSPAPSPSPSPSSTGSASKRHRRSDEPPLHYAFKHLIAVVERSIPRTGLVQLLKGPGNREPAAGRNYLLSLYEHLRELAYLVAESEAKSRETVVVPRNYFSMLSEGPIPTLGRLIFGMKMPPSRLEKVAQKLSLNLNHIIVHSCCPRIPAKHFRLPTFKVCSADLEVRGARIIANSGPTEGTKSSDPNLLVQNILTRLLHLMKDSACLSNARSIFDVTGARMLVRREEWQEVVAMTRELQEVDLALLETKKERQCFYTNLTNLMTVHMHLVYIQRHQVSTESNGDDWEYAVPLPEASECITVLSTDSFFHQSLFAYRVGQLGVVSLFDLKYVVCRQGLLSPTMWGDFLTHRMHSLHPADPWVKYGPPPDTRLLFALADGSLHSPPLQVLTVEMLNVQLQNCMQEYINVTTEINTDSQEVLIGELLVWYRQDFVSEQLDTMDARLFGLVHFLAIHLDPDKSQALQQLGDFDLKHTNLENIDMTGRRELPYKIRIQPLSNDFGFLFDYETLGKCLAFPHRQFGRSMSLPRIMEASSDSVLDRSGSVVEAPTYLLTPQTLEYIKSDSLLVATLVSLVCADELDDIDQHFTDDYFTMGEAFKPRSMSDISLVDIRSYRYRRLTEDFPILQRHLVNYIIPLAGADNPEIFQGSDPVLKFVTNEIEEKVKLCMFSLHSSCQFQGVVHSMLNAFFRERRWGSALSVLRSLPETTMADRGELQASYDFILTCWVLEETENGRMDQVEHGNRLLSLASSFWCAEAGARLALAVCEKLPAHATLQLLEFSLKRVAEPGLKKAVEKQLCQVKLFCKISELVHSLQIKLSIQAGDSVTGRRRSSQHQTSVLANFTDWRNVVAISRTEPHRVLEVLLQMEDFATTREWAQFHSLDEVLMLEIEESHVQLLLNQQNTMKAFQVLEELRKSNEESCLSVCHGLVQKLRNHREVQFVTSYMLTQLTVAMPEEREKLQLQYIGAKALMCLPAAIREEYAQLISCPHLILEQLIMNMQADLAGQVFHKIRNDFSMLRDARHGYTWEQFNSLLTRYATKALEVVVVQSLLDPRFERSSTSSSGGSYRPDESEISGRLSAETHRVRRLALESSYLGKGGGEASPQASPQTTPAVPVLSISPKQQSLSQGEKPARKFVMPAQPPPPEQWVPDSAATVCMVCNIERFSMFNRRHHCRRCGRVVCAACSSHRASVLGVSSRICDECYEQIFLTSSETRQKQEQEIYSQRVRESLSGVSPVTQQSSSLPTGSVPQPHHHAPHNLQAAIAHTTHQWRLHHDETHNGFVREEFYYEQAPSVSLCMSLLKLHSNAKECGVLILKLCDDLSKFLQPVAPGIPNPEVDYILIISMMKQLLFQAKIKFLTSNDNVNLTNCEMYMNRVDLLKTLVVANYTDLPSLQELTKLDYVRRLRDKLVANERLELALEVSARCGLKDVDGLWAAWGHLCLQCGEYAGARDKYSHCLKIPADKNKPAATSRWLTEIVHFLSTEPLTGSREIELLLSNPGGLYEHLISFQKTSQQRFELDSVKGRECHFYLSTYGSHLDYIKFLRQHGYWTKIVSYLQQEQCQGEVFLEGVLQPALVEGELGRLLDNMAMADPTLQSWELYLATACRYLLKHRHFHLLHHVQLFMKDFIRAAMTCVQHFYQQGAQSYLDLAHRLNFLETAIQHLSASWDRSKYGNVPMPGESHTPQGKAPVSWHRSGKGTQGKEAVRMTMTKAEVDRYVRLIQLQWEVTHFLKDCMTSNQQQAAAVASNYAGMAQASRLPTLFGENRARQEVINMVLMSGTIQAGFQLASTIMKDCHMDVATTLTHTGRQLAEQLRLGDIHALMNSLSKAGLEEDTLVDRILGECVLVLIKSQVESKEMENLIKLFKQVTNKINAYILCRKLKSAFMLAVKWGGVEDVQRIAGVAQREGQRHVKSICDRWLQEHNKPD